MNLHSLNYFITVAQEQSLIRASEKLYVTPSTLSQCITREEQALGAKLFVRSRERWTLTEAGKVYVDGCKELIALSRNINNTIQDMVNDTAGEFTLGVTPGRGLALFAHVFPLFREKYPNVRIHVIEANSKRQLRLLAESNIDMFFACNHNPERFIPSSFVYETLAPEECVLFVPKDHPVALAHEYDPSTPAPTLDLSLFKDDYFIGYNKETAMYDAMQDLFRQAQITPKILFESSSSPIIHKLVSNGIGLAILLELYASEAENVRCFRIAQNFIQQNIVVYRPQTFISKPMRCFIDLCKEFFENNKITSQHV